MELQVERAEGIWPGSGERFRYVGQMDRRKDTGSGGHFTDVTGGSYPFRGTFLSLILDAIRGFLANRHEIS